MLILLDIDGVMVSGASWKRPEILNDGFLAFENKAVKSLQKIISETNANILLTTSHKSLFTISEWYNIFKRRCLQFNNIDCLPTDTMKMSRKDEILQWYNTRKADESFAIIDDDKSLNSLPSFLKDKFVLTSSLVGLTDELASEAISILERQEKSNRA